MLAQLCTKIHRALVKGFDKHHVGRDDEANQAFVEYDRHIADAFWIWGVVCERVRTGVDNRITDHWIPPGAVETRVAEVDAQGRPSRLLRVMGEMRAAAYSVLPGTVCAAADTGEPTTIMEV